jgi:hypothetical protein
MRQIVLAAIPFIGLAMLTVALVVILPPLATWLPSLIAR